MYVTHNPFLYMFQNYGDAADLEEAEKWEIEKVENMVITVNPRMTDGSLDIEYEVTWKVLKKLLDKTLTRVYIGTPNHSFDEVIALSDNIKEISPDVQRGRVRIDFKDSYEIGESVTFKYSIHEKNLGILSGKIFRFEFASPMLMTNIGYLTIKWKDDGVAESDCHSQEGTYLIWNKENLPRGETFTANIRYDKSAFSSALSANYIRNLRAGRRGRTIIELVVLLISTLIVFFFWHIITRV